MKIRRFIATASTAGLMAFSATPALADDCSITVTGPSSTNTCTVSDTSTINQTNTNAVTVSNVNNQTATSGNANVSGNTNAGSATTGTASNNNTTSTVVAINNGPALGGGALTGGGTGGTGGGNLSTAQGGTGGGSLGTGGGVGGGELPETGSLSPLDVSGLRALADQSGSGARSDLAAILLSIAMALSLAGAIGSAAYAAKKIVA